MWGEEKPHWHGEIRTLSFQKRSQLKQYFFFFWRPADQSHLCDKASAPATSLICSFHSIPAAPAVLQTLSPSTCVATVTDHGMPKQTGKAGISIPVLSVQGLRLRQIHWPAQDCTSWKRWNGDQSLGVLIPSLGLFVWKRIDNHLKSFILNSDLQRVTFVSPRQSLFFFLTFKDFH